MTWIRTIPLPEADDKLRRALEAQLASCIRSSMLSRFKPTDDGGLRNS